QLLGRHLRPDRLGDPHRGARDPAAGRSVRPDGHDPVLLRRVLGAVPRPDGSRLMDEGWKITYCGVALPENMQEEVIAEFGDDLINWSWGVESALGPTKAVPERIEVYAADDEPDR